MADNRNATITLSLTDLDGESQVLDKALDIRSWGWDMSNPPTKQGSGLSGGTPAISAVQFTKDYCSGSPIIMQYLLEGKHFGTAVLKMYKTTGADGAKVEEFFTITLTKAFVTRYSNGAHEGDVNVGESFDIEFEQIETEYKPQDTSSGSLGAGIHFAYDVMKKQAVSS